jgi:SAM-dependent methyltransferase
MGSPISRHHSVRRSYDAVAEAYAAGFHDERAGKPLDRALLACLAEQPDHSAPIADLGCGPGHVAAWLADRGVTAVGIDLSPAMITVGRRDYPHVEFRVGDLLELPAADGELGAAIAFYSIIHLEAGELHRAFGEIHRAASSIETGPGRSCTSMNSDMAAFSLRTRIGEPPRGAGFGRCG